MGTATAPQEQRALERPQEVEARGQHERYRVAPRDAAGGEAGRDLRGPLEELAVGDVALRTIVLGEMDGDAVRRFLGAGGERAIDRGGEMRGAGGDERPHGLGTRRGPDRGRGHRGAFEKCGASSRPVSA
jgi:hypothetical protein